MPTKTSSGFRIESQYKLESDWLPESAFKSMYSDISSAVAIALEGVDDPEEQEVCVIDVATEEVVWRSTDEKYE